MDESETGNGERKHGKEEVKARQLRDAAALERTCSPPSNVVVEKIKVRFLRNISTGYSIATFRTCIVLRDGNVLSFGAALG